MKVINVRVNGYSVVKDHNTAGAQYEANSTELRIEFNEDWDGYAKEITFWNALGKNPVVGVITPERAEDIIKTARVIRVPIPGEAMTEEGLMTFVIDGYHEGDKKVKKRSVEDTLKVLKSRKEDNPNNASEPTADEVTQILMQIENMRNDIQEAYVSAERAENASSAIGDIYDRTAQLEENVKDYSDMAKEASDSAGKSAQNASDRSDDAEEFAGSAEVFANKAEVYGNKAETSATSAAASALEAKEYAERAEKGTDIVGSDSGTIFVGVSTNQAGKQEISATINPNSISEDEVDDTIITASDYATNNKAGIVQVYGDGGLRFLPMGGNTNYLAINQATEREISGKGDMFKPVTTDLFDFAISKGTHQDMGDGYSPESLTTTWNMEGKQGQLPASYDAVKGYIDGVVGDIESALDELHTYAQSLVSGGVS